MKPKTKPAWSHPEFFFGIVGLIAFFGLPFVQLKDPSLSEFFLRGFDLVTGQLPPRIAEDTEMIYYDPALIVGLWVIPALCLGLILCSAFDFPLGRRILSVMLFSVSVGYTLYLTTDFVDFKKREETVSEYDSFAQRMEKIGGREYIPRHPRIHVKTGIWILLFISFLSIFSAALKRMFTIPEARAKVIPTAPPKEEPDDPFWDGDKSP